MQGLISKKQKQLYKKLQKNIPSKLEQNSILEKIATKEDLKDVKEDIKKLELKLELKIEKSKNQTITLMTIILLLAFFQFFDKRNLTPFTYSNLLSATSICCPFHQKMGILLMKSAYSQ